MDGHAGDPLAVGHQFLGELLFDEVVHAYVALCGHEEIRPDGMEGHALDQTLALAEGVLRPPFAHLVDDHLQITGVVGHDARKVVSFPVPRHLPHGLIERERSEVKVILW